MYLLLGKVYLSDVLFWLFHIVARIYQVCFKICFFHWNECVTLTNDSKTKHFLQSHILAAKTVAHTVRTSLGPNGKLHIFYDCYC